MTTADELLTMKEVAEILKCNEDTAYKLKARGRFRSYRVAGVGIRVYRSDLDAYIRAQQSRPVALPGDRS